MSTATTGRPVGDNEFPVLLRLPDLNATVWLPAPSAATPAVEAVAAPAPQPQWSAPVEIPTIAANSSLVATTTVDVAAATSSDVAAQATTTATVTPPPRSERMARAERSTPAQWTLIRQLATGGVLVGGLALTYFMIMGGGDNETPEHITAAETTLEPPLIETPANLVAVESDSSAPLAKPIAGVSTNDIASVPPPPEFKPFSDEPAMPSHIYVAEKPEATPTRSNDPQRSTSSVPQDMQRDNVRTYQGRIGPEPTYNAAYAPPPGPSYPTTDPSTFIYRPMDGNPQSEAARTARLQGTIAPPPLR